MTTHPPTRAVTSYETGQPAEARGKSAKEKRDKPEAESATASFEMKEITLDPSSLAEATKYPPEDLESGAGAERRGPWSK